MSIFVIPSETEHLKAMNESESCTTYSCGTGILLIHLMSADNFLRFNSVEYKFENMETKSNISSYQFILFLFKNTSNGKQFINIVIINIKQCSVVLYLLKWLKIIIIKNRVRFQGSRKKVFHNLWTLFAQQRFVCQFNCSESCSWKVFATTYYIPQPQQIEIILIIVNSHFTSWTKKCRAIIM